MLVDALREEFALRELLDRLNLPRSSYFYHRCPMRLGDKCAEVRQTVIKIFEEAHRSHGYRRIQAALNKQRVFVAEKVVRRLMKQGGFLAATMLDAPTKRAHQNGGPFVLFTELPLSDVGQSH